MQKNVRALFKYPYFLSEILPYKTKWVRPSSVLLNIIIFVQYISGHHVKFKSMQSRALFCTCKPFVNPRLTGSHVQQHAEFVALKQSARMPVFYFDVLAPSTFKVHLWISFCYFLKKTVDLCGKFRNRWISSLKWNCMSILPLWWDML